MSRRFDEDVVDLQISLRSLWHALAWIYFVASELRASAYAAVLLHEYLKNEHMG